MKLSEALPKLLEMFPVEDHLDYKMGYDNKKGCDLFWVYVPWQKIRARLNRVVGVENWLAEYPAVYATSTGKPVIKCRLTICGVTKEALGFDKSKDSWKGEPAENARADAFKNAAEEFGICEYLDNQVEVIRYFCDQRDPRGLRLSIQYKDELKKEMTELKKAITGGEDSSPPKSPAKTQAITKSRSSNAIAPYVKKTSNAPLSVVSEPVPKPAQGGLYPVNNTIVKRVRDVTGHQPDWIYNYCQTILGCDQPSNVHPQVLPQMIEAMCLDVGEVHFESKDAARKAYKAKVGFYQASGGDWVTGAIEWLNALPLSL